MERSRWTRRAAALVGLGACLITTATATPVSASAPDGRAGAPDGTLVLGHLAPQTGELARVLDSLRVPVQLAVDEINAAGGVLGAPVGLVPGDEGVDPATAEATVTQMLDGGVDAIIGPASSDTALAILDDVRDRALVCSGTNSAAALSTAGPRRSGGRYFRTAAPDRFQGPAIAAQIAAAGHERVSVLARDDPDGALWRRTLVRTLRDAGVRVPAVVTYDEGADPAPAVTDALAPSPDAVVVLGELDDGAAVVQALVAAGAGPQQLPTYGTDAMRSAGFAELVDPITPGVVAGLAGAAPAVAPAVPNPFHETLFRAGVEPVFSAHQYDCTILTALAAVKAGSDDPRRMARAFASNLKGEDDCDSFATCRDLLEAGQSIHYRGASSRFERFGRHEPNEGVYQPWAYDAEGIPRDADPSTQITVP